MVIASRKISRERYHSYDMGAGVEKVYRMNDVEVHHSELQLRTDNWCHQQNAGCFQWILIIYIETHFSLCEKYISHMFFNIYTQLLLTAVENTSIRPMLINICEKFFRTFSQNPIARHTTKSNLLCRIYTYTCKNTHRRPLWHSGSGFLRLGRGSQG